MALLGQLYTFGRGRLTGTLFQLLQLPSHTVQLLVVALGLLLQT